MLLTGWPGDMLSGLATEAGVLAVTVTALGWQPLNSRVSKATSKRGVVLRLVTLRGKGSLWATISAECNTLPFERLAIVQTRASKLLVLGGKRVLRRKKFRSW